MREARAERKDIELGFVDGAINAEKIKETRSPCPCPIDGDDKT